MAGKQRPLDSGRKDALGRTVKVAADAGETRADAPAPVVFPEHLTDADRLEIDELFDKQFASLEERQYVLVVRDPDASNDYRMFGDGVGRIEPIDIDLGALDLSDRDELRGWVMGHMGSVAQVTNPAAREAYLSLLYQQNEFLPGGADAELAAAIAYASSKPMRAAPVSFDTALTNVAEEVAKFEEAMPDGFMLMGFDNEAPVGLDPIQFSLDSDQFGPMTVSYDGDGEFMVYVNESGDEWDEGEYEVGDIFGDDANEAHAALRQLHSMVSGFAFRYGKHGLEQFAAKRDAERTRA